MIKLSDMNLTEYDERQINLMKDKLNSFISSKISFKELIDDLRALLNCLQSVDMAWKELFYEYWFILEQVYAVALDRNESIDNYNDYLSESIKQLKSLLSY
ncbi:hypothetical protein HX037_10205 [Ignatzschineria indica]|uniref:hypothetical protein n=1 Tax=Ignatzschineria indica TaxID=472583 RepID=UPI00257659D8|nr:hypothetical protein [Ignatzschineria indica]MDM1546234.1 hypothetical protein [Ignatzschineria indica]